MTSFSMLSLNACAYATGRPREISKQVANIRPLPFTIDTTVVFLMFSGKVKVWKLIFIVMFYEIIICKSPTIFRGINPEKYHCSSYIFRYNSSGNFQTHSSRLIHVSDCYTGHFHVHVCMFCVCIFMLHGNTYTTCHLLLG